MIPIDLQLEVNLQQQYTLVNLFICLEVEISKDYLKIFLCKIPPQTHGEIYLNKKKLDLHLEKITSLR